MNNFKFYCVLITLVTWSAFSLYAQNAETKEYYGLQAGERIAGASYVKAGLHSTYPSFVRFNETAQIKPGNFASWIKSSLKLDAEIDFSLVRTELDQLGFEHKRYVQTYKGIPVEKSMYIVHSKNDRITSFNGIAFDIADANSSAASLSEKEALNSALNDIRADRYKWEDEYWENNLKENKGPEATYYPKGEMIWFKQKDETFRLAYKFDIYAASPGTSHRYFVDAQNGNVLNIIPLEHDCSGATVNTIFNGNQSINTDKYTANDFRLRDDCQAATVRVRDWNSATTTSNPVEIENTTNTWTTMNERFGATVLWEINQSYLYFLNVHSRASVDNADGIIEAYINAIFSCSTCPGGVTANNASMSGDGMTLKVGLSSAGTLANSYATIDILGHEYTHAVTGFSADLEYQDESGALNESFSDIFGDVIERYVTGSNDWLMGNDRTNGAIRDMSDPNNSSQPHTYLGDFWCDYTDGTLGCTTNDNGGVHTNSGVQNYWFYLISVGDSGINDNGDSYNVSPIGINAATDIAYRNLTVYLGTNSTFSDARDGAISAAIDLYGACSDEVKQVTNAWYAVGVGEPAFDVNAVVASDYNGRDVSCFNACDGSATANVTTGLFPIYQWNTGATTQTIENLCPGTYTVTVTNLLGLGCSETGSVTIDNTPQLIIPALTLSDYNGYNVSCNGGSDGTANASPSGGTPPYTYLWSNGQAAAKATGLSATTYTVTVTDANGCSETESATLTEPPALTIDAGLNTTVYFGYPDSSCTTLEASDIGGGVPPYTITWSTGSNAASINVCPMVTTVYYLSILDANGCEYTDSVRVCVIDVRCGNNLNKVSLCHTTGGVSNQSLCVALSGAITHIQGHIGDQLAACGTVKTCEFPEGVRYVLQGSDEVFPDAQLIAMPNPFSATTTIRFMSPVDDFIRLQVVDVSGREIENLYEGNAQAGIYYDVDLDGNNLQNGVYFLVMRVNDGYTITEKLMLNK